MDDLISREGYKKVIDEQLRFYDPDSSPWHVKILELQRELLDSMPAVDAIPVDWLRKKMQKPLMTCDNPFDYVLSTWQDEQRKETQDGCNYNDE